ncbi:streptogrisin C [Promicromonospora umidemergens]|uniref:Alpha-lytic protease prodomain-containing protein n=1 Tax=Promicromonospora umidemergens TaxID=629679 RepID=A0ABP8X252_9MICO|nr:S1 family peptidase [Promicromonospora umidemergens]MCP2285048.1 streptogrisin C [Promicromonospora umidemergens]
MRRTSFRAITVATAAATLFAASITAATAGIAAGSDRPEVAGYAPGMVAALERDLGLTTSEAVDRLKTDEALSEKQLTIAKTLDKGYAGAWVDGSELFVAVTDRSAAAEVRAAGANAVTVDRSLSQLDRLATKAYQAAPEAKIAATYVDVEFNSVVMEVAEGAKGAVAAAVKQAGISAGSVSVVEVAELPRTLINVIGGNAYYIGGSRCSVGFSATGGFVTAGHCGSRGATTSQPSGTFQVSSFPGNDYGYVSVGSDDNPVGAVNNYNGGTVNVAGSSQAAVGATVCRSGSTTGWHCGTIQAFNATVNYAQGSVHGLIRTNVCAEPGDSGGSLLAGAQAQGLTSGGSGNCSSGGTTYFQPVNEALSAANVSLITGGGGSTPPPTACEDERTAFSGSLGSGGQAAEPGTTGFSVLSGTITGCLDGPTGTDFDLYLQKVSGGSWTTVAQGITAAADESVSYRGTSGTYRWVVDAYSGSGSYTGGYTTP